MKNDAEFDQFSTHERLLWRVLAALARDGFVAPPDEGRDLIHDFYVQAWAGVLERFDGAKSTFATYLSAAFYRFGRRRIVRLQEWKYRLVELDSISEQASPALAPHQVLEDSQQLDVLRRALLSLPAKERELLYEYVSGDQSGEREMARKRSMTRYALREELATAIGRLAAEVGKLPTTDRVDASVAHHLWNQGSSAKSTATSLGLTVPEVNAVKTRLVSGLLQTLRSFEPPRTQRRTTMNEYLEILQGALSAPSDGQRLEHVRAHRVDILAALNELEDDIDFGNVTRYPERREWVAKVYATLAGDDADQEAETAVGQAVKSLRSRESREVGEAFEQLLEGTEPLANWRRYFGDLPDADVEIQRYLEQDESVAAAGRYGYAFLSKGLTPMMFFGATRGLQLMFDRVRRSAVGQADVRTLELWRGTSRSDAAMRLELDGHDAVYVPKAAVASQIAGTKNLPANAGPCLAQWIADATFFRPYLVNGYLFDAEIDLVRPDETFKDVALMARWCTSAQQVAV